MSENKEMTSLVRLGELLKSARQRRDMTIKELSEDPEVSVSSAFLSRVERNDALPSDDLLIKLSRKLGVDPTVALMHLMRERASPQAREFLPLPTRLRAPEPAGDTEGDEGLRVLDEPLAQVIEAHRGVLRENARLRAENAELARDLAERQGRRLPDVNRFIADLFNYKSELFRRDAVVSRNGDATITVTVQGMRPEPGKSLYSLDHGAYIPQAPDREQSILGNAAHLEILEKPGDLRLEWSFRRESDERGKFVVTFPDGFHGSRDSRHVSYRFSYRLQKAFVMTVEEAKASYGRGSVHDQPYEWSSCYINKPTRRLESSVTFPEGYSPNYIDKWVWWSERSFLEIDYNLADKLLVDTEDGIEIEEGERTVIRLRAQNPLVGFNYGIVWMPLLKRQFVSLLGS